MPQRPAALGIQQGVEVGSLFVQNFRGGKPVKPQQPVRLVQPVLPQQGRRRAQGGQVPVAHHRHIGGVKHPLQPVLAVQPFAELQNLPVALRGGAHNHLGGLPCRGKRGGMAVGGKRCFVLPDAVSNQSHGGEDLLLALLGSQQLQASLAGQLNVYTHPVRVQSQLVGQLRGGSGNGLHMDVSSKPVLPPQLFQNGQHPFAGVVRAAHHGRAQK